MLGSPGRRSGDHVWLSDHAAERDHALLDEECAQVREAVPADGGRAVRRFYHYRRCTGRQAGIHCYRWPRQRADAGATVHGRGDEDTYSGGDPAARRSLHCHSHLLPTGGHPDLLWGQRRGPADRVLHLLAPGAFRLHHQGLQHCLEIPVSHLRAG